MTFHYSRGLAEEFWGDNCSDGEPSVQSNKNPMPLAFCSKDKMTRFSRLSQYGMTFAPLTESRGEELLTLFLEDFHVKTSHRQEEEQALKEKEADSGQRWQESLGKLNLNGSLQKTHQCLFPEDSISSLQTLPKWGLMLDGELWEQTMSEHLTREKESGLLEETFPTPMASDNRDRGNISDPAIQRRIKLGKQISLTMAVKKEKGGGSLNPRWTEWLMGFPIGHTNLKPLEMDKYQKWLELHGKY